MVDAIIRQMCRQIETKKRSYLADMGSLVAMPSVSSTPQKVYEVMKAAYWMEDRLKACEARIEMCPYDIDDTSDRSAKKPALLLAALGDDITKNTVLVYGHVDVHPARWDSSWNGDPFTMMERDGYLYGRGVSDNKGPVLSWLHVVELFREMKQPMPVNLKLILDCHEEVGSPDLANMLDQKKKFLESIKYVCITDTTKVGNKPCIVYSCRGLCYLNITVTGTNQDLHSGAYGGILYEPLADLIYLLDALEKNFMKLKYATFHQNVVQPTPEEERAYNILDFDVNEMRKFTGAPRLLHRESKSRLLIHRWQLPSMTVHGIEGAFAETGGRTVIPGGVTAKVSVRLVPNQTVQQVVDTVNSCMKDAWSHRRSANNMEIVVKAAVAPWVDNPCTKHYQAARRAVKNLTGIDPDLVRHGGTLSAAPVLQAATNCSVCVIPLGGRDDGPHGNNERMAVKDYIEGHKLIVHYLYELSKL